MLSKSLFLWLTVSSLLGKTGHYLFNFDTQSTPNSTLRTSSTDLRTSGFIGRLNLTLAIR